MILFAKNLEKEYQVPQSKPGVMNRLRSFVTPQYRSVQAVKEFNLAVEEGEMVAFIGPNGAGKSTCMKMFTGILHPTSGDIKINGKDPFQNRRKLAKEIGTVFGQKSQLWYHLPAKDTFELLKRIYEIPESRYRKQLNQLFEWFDLADIAEIPVRKLSLGQRMKCEIAASMLHQPKLFFLDEPTIGLDLIAKQQIRTALREMNRETGTTVILTSHDPSDIESLCQRVVIVNHGTKIFDQTTEILKNEFYKERCFSVTFETGFEWGELPKGVTFERIDATQVKFRLNTSILTAGEFTQWLFERASVRDLLIENPSMEQIIQSIYLDQRSQGGTL